jgi:hypothetical protein
MVDCEGQRSDADLNTFGLTSGGLRGPMRWDRLEPVVEGSAMTVEWETSRRPAGPVYRGAHESDERQRWTLDERIRIVVFATAIIVLVLVFFAALAPLRRGRSSPLPPVPAVLSGLPLAPVPHSPSLVPSPSGVVADPPGFPTALPTAEPSTPSSPSLAPQPAPVVRTVSYEAESAANTLTGNTHIRAVAAASGGEVIVGIGDGGGNTLRFNQVAVPADGVYTLAIYYLSGADHILTISRDGGPAVSVGFSSTGDRETVGSLALRVGLRAGANTIEFGNSVACGPDIDRITVGG